MGKLKTEFTSPKAKSTSPGLSDTTFFKRCFGKKRHRKSLVLEQNLCIYEQQPDDKSKINGSHNIVHLLISDRKLKYRKEIKVITTKSKHTDV